MYKISLAPLQGITDYYFRNAFAKNFTPFDLAYTPYIKLEKGLIRKSLIRDVAPENNSTKVIPQIMTNKVEEFLFLDKYLNDLGYQEINWNLGCPYPMVTKKKLGSGMLEHPELIDSILAEVTPKLKTSLSVKMRSGFQNETDYQNVLTVLNKYALREIILHPRMGKQLYKGSANTNIFEEALSKSKNPLAYNGDIVSLEKFNEISSKFKDTEHFMIGRALISNPFLVGEIKGEVFEGNKTSQFKEFYYDLESQYEERLSGEGHLLNKMLNLWEYFSVSFSNNHKVFKAIKKAKTKAKYNEAIHYIFHNEEFL